MKTKRIKQKKPKTQKAGDLELRIEDGQILITNPQQNNTYRISESRGMLSILKNNKFDMSDEILIKPVVGNRIMIH